MPWVVFGEGCFTFDEWGFDCLGDAKEAIKWLKPRYEAAVSHYIEDEARWCNHLFGRVYETFDDFVDDNGYLDRMSK